MHAHRLSCMKRHSRMQCAQRSVPERYSGSGAEPAPRPAPRRQRAPPARPAAGGTAGRCVRGTQLLSLGCVRGKAVVQLSTPHLHPPAPASAAAPRAPHPASAGWSPPQQTPAGGNKAHVCRCTVLSGTHKKSRRAARCRATQDGGTQPQPWHPIALHAPGRAGRCGRRRLTCAPRGACPLGTAAAGGGPLLPNHPTQRRLGQGGEAGG